MATVLHQSWIIPLVQRSSITVTHGLPTSHRCSKNQTIVYYALISLSSFRCNNNIGKILIINYKAHIIYLYILQEYCTNINFLVHRKRCLSSYNSSEHAQGPTTFRGRCLQYTFITPHSDFLGLMYRIHVDVNFLLPQHGPVLLAERKSI